MYDTPTNHLGIVVALGNASGGLVTGSYAAYEPFGTFLVPPTATTSTTRPTPANTPSPAAAMPPSTAAGRPTSPVRRRPPPG